MTETTRPAAGLIKDAYDHLFNSGLSLSKLRDAALGNCLFPSSGDAFGIVGRSIAWKLFLTSNEPLQSSSGLEPASPLDALRASRKEYLVLLLEKMRAPDGSYEEGFVLPGSYTSPKRIVKTAGNLETNNPLSLHNENPWTEWFAQIELRKTILQDVERTFPEIGFFRDSEVQSQLTNVLFMYSVTNPDIGYRQGMHELLAPLYYAVDYDSIEDGDPALDDLTIREVCSRQWVAADAWALFDSVMRGVERWYEWREAPLASRNSVSPLATHVNLNIPDGRIDIKSYVAPIVQACHHIQSKLLRTVDPLLWKHMQAAGIEPQIYGIRWLRLLFTREFSMHDSMILWTGLFACDPTFDLAPWVCVAMLVRIRNELIPSDYSGQLTVLLRYPSPHLSLASAPHHTSLLLRQALALQMSPTPSTGASLVIENRNFLNIPIEVPDPPPAAQSRLSRAGRQKSASVSAGQTTSDQSSSRAVHGRLQSSQHIGLPEMIARGLLERGESLGINKTVMSAVSELRRNIPDLAASLVRSPSTASTFPLTDDRPPEERPPWEPRTRFEMERDISKLRALNRQLGQSLGWIVDVLLQDESDVKDPQRLQDKQRQALESLSYVRDVLNGGGTEAEEERLFDEEEFNKRKLKAKESDMKNGQPQNDLDVHQPVAPTPVPVVDSRPKISSSRSSRKYDSRSPPQPSPITSLPVGASLPSPRSPSTSSTLIPALSPNSGSTRLAPWNYTCSNFSGATLPTSTLPRMPPPTSTGFRRTPAIPSTARKSRSDEESPIRSEAQLEHDPLGVLP